MFSTAHIGLKIFDKSEHATKKCNVIIAFLSPCVAMH